MQIGDDINVVLDETSPAHDFHDGKSYFSAYKLPDNVPTFSVFVQSRAEKTVFAPSVLLLDANRQPVRVIPASSAVYKPAEMFTPDSLNLAFNIERSYLDNPKTEYYMVLFTTPQDALGETQMIHPAKTAAERSNTTPPDIADPIAKHSSGGLVNLYIAAGNVTSNQGVLTQMGNSVNSWFGQGSVDNGASGVAVGTTAATVAATSSTALPPQPIVNSVPERSPVAGMQVQSAAPTSAAAMLKETETFYNQLISAKVTEGDIDSAMKLVEEAERAGSKSARKSFIDAVKQLK
nr:MalM family protein [Echinimonas agarilytica]